jgi:hypothetical protein
VLRLSPHVHLLANTYIHLLGQVLNSGFLQVFRAAENTTINKSKFMRAILKYI